MRTRLNVCISALIASLFLIAAPGYAKTLRWASQGDLLTFDPYAQNESFNNTFNSATSTNRWCSTTRSSRSFRSWR